MIEPLPPPVPCTAPVRRHSLLLTSPRPASAQRHAAWKAEDPGHPFHRVACSLQQRPFDSADFAKFRRVVSEHGCIFPVLGNHPGSIKPMASIMRGWYTFLGFVLHGVAWTQCLTSIPATTVTISQSSAGVIDGSGGTYWVCPQAYQQVFVGDNNTLFVEDGAIIGVMGDHNAIFYRSINNALGLYGDSNTVSVNALSNIVDNGNENTIHVCDANGITFDLTDAPAPGCLSTGMATDPPTAVVRLDLSKGMLQVYTTSPLRELIIHDAQGRIAQYATGAEAVDIAGLAPGWYFARISTGTGWSVHRFGTF